MAACGVNLFGLDQLHPGDARLANLVWSWAPDGWTGGDCAYAGTDGRFRGGDCRTKRRVACQDAGGAWSLSDKAVAFKQAAKACKRDGAFAVPATGWEMTQLRAAAGGTEAWLDYARVNGDWVQRAT